jgi:hypothetical protein
MAAEDILGISGQIDISDIQTTLDKLCDQLNKVGVDTDALSQRMTNALNDIAKSDGDLSTKTTQAMNVLKQAMDEATNGIKIVPEMIDTANKRVETIRGTIERLNEQLSQTERGSNAFNAIAKQIDAQKQVLQMNQEDARFLASSYDEVRNSIAQVSGAYQALEAISVASSTANTIDAAASEANSVAKTANSVASTANAASTLAEGVSHADNATKLGQETDAVVQNTKARQEHQENISAEEQMYGRLIDRMQQGSLSEEQYQRIIDQETASLEEQRKALNELAQQREEHNSRPFGNGYQFDSQGNVTNSADVEKWQAETQSINQQFEAQKKIVEESQAALDKFVEAHERLAKSQDNAANTSQKTQEASSQEIKSFEQLTSEIDALEKKISDLQQRKQELLSVGGGFSIPVVPADALANSGLTFGSDKLEGLRTLNQEIETTKEKLSEAKGKLQEFQQSGEETGNVSFANYSQNIADISFAINDAKQRLADYEAQYDKLANKDNLTAKQKQDLDTLGQKIDETKKQIQDLQEQLREKNEQTFVGKLRDSLSDAGQKVSEFGEKIKSSILSPLDALKEKVGNSSFAQRFGAEFTQAKVGLNDFKDGIVNVMTANGKLQAQIGVIGEAFKGLGIPVAGSLTAIKAVTKALWAMCATPIGAVIAAVALAFKAVHTWMTKSAEGQKVYTRLMAYFGSLAKSVTDIIIIFGEYLYKSFTKPNGPLRDFGRNFVKTFKTAITAVVNLLGGLGTTIKGVLNMDWVTFTSGLKKTWEGLKGAGETIIDVFKTQVSGVVGAVKLAYNAFTDDNLGKKLGSAFGNMLTNASQAASLAGKIKDTEIAISQNKEKQAKLDIKIAEARNKIYTLQGKEKIAAIEETKALIKQKYDTQIKQQQQLVELHEKNGKLHTKSLEDIAKERELRIQVLRTQTQMVSEQRMLTRQEASAKRSLASKEKSSAKSAQSAAQKMARQEQQINAAEDKLDEVTFKNAYERTKAEQELESKVYDAKIKAMKEGSAKVIAERNRELEKEIEQIEKEKEAAIKAERDRQKAEFDAKQAVAKAKGEKIDRWDEKKHLDQEPIKKIEAQYQIIEQKTIDNTNNQTLQENLQSYREYLKEYGGLQEQRLAIVEEYNEKIDEAIAKGNLFDAAKLKKELEEQIKNLNFSDFKDSINWEAIFSDMGNLSASYLEQLRKKLKELLSSGTLNVNDMKAVSEQITKIDEAISKQKDYWGISNEKVREHKRLLEEAAEAQEELNKAQTQLASAQVDVTDKKMQIQSILSDAGVNVSLKDITPASKDNTLNDNSVKLNAARIRELSKLFDELAISEAKAGKATKDVQKATEKKRQADDKAKQNIYDLAEIVAVSLSKIQQKLKDLPGLLDAIGLGDSALGKAVNNGMDALNSGTQAAADFATGNYIGAAMNGIKTIQSVGRIFGIGGGNAAEVAKTTEKLTEANERLKYSIEQLKESIDNSSGMNAVDNYQKAYDAQERINQQTMEILKTQMGYHGAHHSNAYYWGLSDADYAAINKTLSQQAAKNGGYTNASVNSVHSLEDIYKLTPEQMKDIRTYNQDVWKNMMDQGKYDKSEYWENYTDLAGKLEELTDKINQNLTQTSFDSMRQNFISNLMDMSKSAQDFANDFTTLLNKAMLNFAVGDLMDKKLKPLYEKWADKMKNGQLSDEDLKNLKREYQDIVDEGIAIRDNISSITGYKEAQSLQTATGKGIEAITADQASSLIGIGYAMQIAVQQGNDTRNAIAMDVSSLRATAEILTGNISEMRDIQYQGLEQLQAINKNTAPIILIREDISNMYKLMKERY